MNEIPETHCPKCNVRLDMVSSRLGSNPREGDYCICINCYVILKFTKNLKIYVPDTEIPEDVLEEREAFLKFQRSFGNGR